MWNLRMVNFDNFGGLTSVLKFHIFLIFNCAELVRIRAICKGLVRFSQMWRIGTQFSQMWRIGTSSSHLWRIGTQLSQMWRIRSTCSHMWRIGTYFSQMSMTEFAISSHMWKILFITDFGCTQRVSFSYCLQWELIALSYYIRLFYKKKTYTNNLPNSASYPSLHPCFLLVSYECTSS